MVDLLAIELSLVASSAIAGIRPGVFDLAWDALPMLVVWALIFKLYGLYDRDIKRISHTGIDDLPWVFHSLIVGTLALWIYMKLVPDQQMLLREVAWFAVFSLPLVILARSLARRAIVHALGSENVLIAANGATCELIARKLDAHPEYGQRPKAILVPLGDSKIPPQAAAIAEPWVRRGRRARADDRDRRLRPRPGRPRRLRGGGGLRDDGPLPALRRQGRRPARGERRLRALPRARRGRGGDGPGRSTRPSSAAPQPRSSGASTSRSRRRPCWWRCRRCS